jgi:DNA-directed RNA polymerase III subunit RPC1
LDVRGRPEQLVMTHLIVPPVCIRPSVEMESAAGSNEDDITMKLMQIIEVNKIVEDALQKGLAINQVMVRMGSVVGLRSFLNGFSGCPKVHKRKG